MDEAVVFAKSPVPRSMEKPASCHAVSFQSSLIHTRLLDYLQILREHHFDMEGVQQALKLYGL